MLRFYATPLVAFVAFVALAALAAGCTDRPERPAVIDATVVDSLGRPAAGAHVRIRTWHTSTVAPVTAATDSAGRVRIRLDARGMGIVEFAPDSTTVPGDRVYAPLLLGPDEAEVWVRLGGDSATARYPAARSRMARWGRAVELGRVIERRHDAAYTAWVAAGQVGALQPGLRPLVDSVATLLRDEKDPEIRTALWIARLKAAVRGGDTLSAETAEGALAGLDPAAEVWGWDPFAGPGLIAHAVARAEGVDRTDPEPGVDELGRRELASRRADLLIDRVVESHPERHVRSYLLLAALRLADREGRPEAADRYYHRIVDEYPDSDEARMAAMMAPGNRLRAGDPLPDVAFPALDSTAAAFTPADLAGPATLVDFWAVWCVPCVAEIPVIRAAYERFAGRGLRVVSVSFDATREDVVAFRATHRMPWEHAYVGADQLFDGPVPRAYNLSALPYAILVGPDGTVRALESDLRGTSLERTLERMLDGG
jgi:thiol-disulfide isomerase/thioredoxin